MRGDKNENQVPESSARLLCDPVGMVLFPQISSLTGGRANDFPMLGSKQAADVLLYNLPVKHVRR